MLLRQFTFSTATTLLLSLLSFTSHAHGTHHHEITAEERKISQGEFSDRQVKDRPLSDWDGVWQSVYPYLSDGTLKPVLTAKAKAQHKTVSELENYYQTGYKTDIQQINIENNIVEFQQNGHSISCRYRNAGLKIVNYPSGKRGVRYLFECSEPYSQAPRFIQFSDHRIAPHHSDHFHIFIGNQSQAALLGELHHWPTYYPYQQMPAEIVEDMLHH